jgi:XTP/dITP diphosphohydrolase
MPRASLPGHAKTFSVRQTATMNGKLFLASSNTGKLMEFLALAGTAALAKPSLPIELLPGFASFPLFEEKAPTFAENATGKALHYSHFADEMVFADDSGLVVPALGGAPGVLSARYAGPTATSEERNAKLLDEMQKLRGENRRAYFVCTIALAKNSRPIAIVSARVDGEILEAPRGTHGFGYDPIFYIPDLKQSFAEIPSEQKNQWSHRGKAFRRLALVIESL